VLSKPFVKAKGSSSSAYPGYSAIQSGRRSAIAKVDGQKFYRFKGCGDLDLGFHLRAMDRPKEAREIRGAMFENTTI